MKKFSYTINGGKSDREFAVTTFGEETVSLIEAIMDGFDTLKNMSISTTSKLGNRLTITYAGTQ